MLLLSCVLAAAARAARLLEDPSVAQPFVQPLCDALEALRRPPAPPAPVLSHQELLESQLRQDVDNQYWCPESSDFYLEAEQIRALLLEVIRRAAHDWVLYRTSSRLDQKELASDAFTWLFKEKPGHPSWKIRHKEKRDLTSFLNICELLDLDPGYAREKIQLLTPRAIKMAGRPAEHRRRKDGCEYAYYSEYNVSDTISLEQLETG